MDLKKRISMFLTRKLFARSIIMKIFFCTQSAIQKQKWDFCTLVMNLYPILNKLYIISCIWQIHVLYSVKHFHCCGYSSKNYLGGKAQVFVFRPPHLWGKNTKIHNSKWDVNGLRWDLLLTEKIVTVHSCQIVCSVEDLIVAFKFDLLNPKRRTFLTQYLLSLLLDNVSSQKYN